MKLAWFEGTSSEPEHTHVSMTQDQINADADRGGPTAPTLRLLLVPDDLPLTSLVGDDFDDAPASLNAGAPYADRLPDGCVWLTVRLGDCWPHATTEEVAPGDEG